MPTAPPSARAPRRRVSLGRRGVLVTLAGGNALTAALAIGSQPVLARLFTPAEFGIAETFVAALTVVFPVASLRYEDALVLPESDDDARAIWHVAAALTGIVALVLMAAPLAGPWLRGGAYGDLVPFLGLLAPGLLALRLQRLADAWLVRTRRYGALTAANVARSAATGGARLAYGAAGAGHGLVTGFVLGNAVAVLAQIRAVVSSGLFASRPSWAAMRRVAVRYRRFAGYTAPSALLAALSSRLPLLALAALFPLDVVGWLGRVILVVATPIGFLGAAASRVLVAEGAAAHRDGRLASVVADTHRLLARVGAWPLLALLVAGPDAFEVVFGAAWREAGVYARLTAPWLVLATHAATLTPVFDLTERHRRDLASTLALTLGIGAALVAARALALDARATVALLGVVGAGLRIVHLGALLHVARVGVRESLAAFVRPAGLAAATLVPVAALVASGAPPLWTVAALGVSGAAYAAALLRR